MIVLDTHIWVWLVSSPDFLSPKHTAYLEAHEQEGLGVCAISVWEVAMLIARGRLNFSLAAEDWLEQALGYPGVRLLELSPRIALKSAQLPGNFHKDPADQMIVETALVLDFPLMTMDTRVLNYPHVKLVP